jgi:hypothetical protein
VLTLVHKVRIVKHPSSDLVLIFFFNFQTLKGQKNRDDKIKTLLLTMRDMLEFVDDVDAVPKITKLQSTVRSMMTQIYECALFIQAYGGVGLISMCHNPSK